MGRMARLDRRVSPRRRADAIAAVLALSAGSLLADPPAEAAAKKRPPSIAHPELRTCRSAYETAQTLEASGRLLAAKDQFFACTKAACGTFLHEACTARFTRLEADIPTIVPVLADEHGALVIEARFAIDGREVGSRLDGRPFAVDPGIHQVSAAIEGGAEATETILVVQGQRNRALRLSLGQGAEEKRPAEDASPAPARAAPVAPSSEIARPSEVQEGGGGPSPWAFVIGGAGLGAIGGGALLIYWGRKDNDALSRCSPSCPIASVDHIRKLYLAADAAIGAGVVALAAAYWVYAATGYSVAVEPASSGAVATFGGRF
jgi:hypothetical protein